MTLIDTDISSSTDDPVKNGYISDLDNGTGNAVNDVIAGIDFTSQIANGISSAIFIISNAEGSIGYLMK